MVGTPTDSASRLEDLGGLRVNFTIENRDEKDIEYLRLFHDLCHKVCLKLQT